MKKNLFGLCAFAAALLSCNASNTSSKPASAGTPMTMAERRLADSISLLRAVAKPGDLIVRLGDDFLSYYIKFLNEKDYSFSHAGVIIEKAGQKLVAHIAPDSAAGDGIVYVPIDSFINPAKTLRCALFRYDIPQAEKDKAVAVIDAYRQSGLRFDRLYDLTTNDRMYCSEMISKAFAKATQNRLRFKTINVPPKMRPLLAQYFNRQLPMDTIAKRPIVSIDNLYLMPECKRILSFSLQQTN